MVSTPIYFNRMCCHIIGLFSLGLRMGLEPLGTVLNVHRVDLLGQLNVVNAQPAQAVRVQNNFHVAIARQVQIGMMVLPLGNGANGVDGVQRRLEITGCEGARDGVLLLLCSIE